MPGWAKIRRWAMRDEARDEQLHIAALQELLLPLREPCAPWGEVLARARVATVSVPPRRIRYAAISAAIAASLVLGWAWARRGTEPTPTPEHATNVDVAAPFAAFELAPPPRLPVEDMPASDLAPAKPPREDAK
ncbi:MAG: hypothetical protein IAG13_01335, partial [Deltaproteobacteria bacterium]|nr:hypothetical protein [Nannocystaceae bacterium]